MTIVKNNKEVENISLVAVYGTLRKGQQNNYILNNGEYVGEYNTPPIYTMYSLSAFPGVVNGGVTSIKMEVFRVNESIKRRLDGLEGYIGPDNESNLYNKEIIDTPFGKAFFYTYNNTTSTKPEVESGDWVDYKRSLLQSINKIQQNEKHKITNEKTY